MLSKEKITKQITVVIEIDVPAHATDSDIRDWVDVQYGECGSMNPDNSCKNDYEIIEHYIR